MDGQQIPVDNSTPTPSLAPAAPEPTAAPTPDTNQTVTGARTIDTLHALLDGADPAMLFGQQQSPAAANTPQPAEPPAEPAPTEPRFEIPDKFKNPDGSINNEAILKSYMGMEKVLGEQGNKLGLYERQLQEAAQIIQQFQQPQTPPAPAEPAPPPEPEWAAPTMDEYYEDPLGTVNKLLEKQAKDMMNQFKESLKPLTPVVQKHQYESEVQIYSNRLAEFAQANPDIMDILPEMQTIGEMLGREAIKALEASGKDPIQLMYNTAKSLHKPAPPSPDQLLKDQGFRQKILSDETIKNEFLKSHVQAVKGGAPPPVIGSQPGGMPPATPSEKPRSAREATSMVSRWLRGQ